MKKKLMILGAILLIGGASALIISRLDRKHEEGTLVVSGNVEVTEVNVGFKTPGRIVGLLVEEGAKINDKDKLAVLDSAELESQVVQARAFLNETTIRLGELKAGPRSQEVGLAKANQQQAEAELDKAGKDYERAKALYKKDAIAAQDLDAAKKGYEVAVARRQQAAEGLSLVREGPRKEEKAAAESRVRQAEAALKALSERLKDTVASSPVAGVVLRKNVENGEMVAAGVPVYTIGELGRPWIKVYVKEDKLGLIKLGQKAEVSVDSFPGKKYQGHVSFISSEAEFTPRNVQTQEERVKLVFGVKVSVININDELKPGMPADVKILLK